MVWLTALHLYGLTYVWMQKMISGDHAKFVHIRKCNYIGHILLQGTSLEDLHWHVSTKIMHLETLKGEFVTVKATNVPLICEKLFSIQIAFILLPDEALWVSRFY